jgi:hypothetical protein
MVIFLWILGIIIFLNVIALLILFSSIRFKINTINIKTKDNFSIDSFGRVIYELDNFEKISMKEFFPVIKKYVIDINYSFEISFYLLRKVKLCSLEVTNLYIKFAKKKIKISKVRKSKVYAYLTKDDIKLVKKIKLAEIKKLLPRVLNLKLDIGIVSENPKISYYLITFLNIIISIFMIYLKTNDKNGDYKNWKYLA